MPTKGLIKPTCLIQTQEKYTHPTSRDVTCNVSTGKKLAIKLDAPAAYTRPSLNTCLSA